MPDDVRGTLVWETDSLVWSDDTLVWDQAIEPGVGYVERVQGKAPRARVLASVSDRARIVTGRRGKRG